MRRLCLALLVAGGLFQTSVGHAAVITLDTFNTAIARIAIDPVPNPNFTGIIPVASALGGFRDSRVLIDGNFGAPVPNAGIGTAFGLASFSSNDLISAVFTLNWTNLTGLIPTPVSLSFPVLSNDTGGSFQLQINGVNFGAPIVLAPMTTPVISFPLAGAPAINSLTLVFDGNIAADVSIGPPTITTDGKVPEPSTFVMAGMFLGLLGGGFLLRRRFSKSPAVLAA